MLLVATVVVLVIFARSPSAIGVGFITCWLPQAKVQIPPRKTSVSRSRVRFPMTANYFNPANSLLKCNFRYTLLVVDFV